MPQSIWSLRFFIYMPFKSKAQLRKFGQLLKEGKISTSTFKKWIEETKNIKNLPERAKKYKKYAKKKRN